MYDKPMRRISAPRTCNCRKGFQHGGRDLPTVPSPLNLSQKWRWRRTAVHIMLTRVTLQEALLDIPGAHLALVIMLTTAVLKMTIRGMPSITTPPVPLPNRPCSPHQDTYYY
jgi:hypothetical protein